MSSKETIQTQKDLQDHLTDIVVKHEEAYEALKIATSELPEDWKCY